MGIVYTRFCSLTFLILILSCVSLAQSASDFPQTPQFTENPSSLYNLNQFSKATLTSDLMIPLFNASGITLNKKENLLYVIINNLSQIHVYESTQSVSGRALQSITLHGWNNSSIKDDKDLEDIVYLGENDEGHSEFALVSEGTPKDGADVYICEVHYLMTTLDRSDCDRIHVDIPIQKSNRGAEGLAYNSQHKTFYIAIEGNESGRDLRISQFLRPNELQFHHDPTGARSLADVRAVDLFDAESKLARFAPDISSLVFSEKNQRLYVLTHVGERAVDIDLQGTIYGVFPLPQNLQFEGIGFDADHNLVFVSEPNVIYKYDINPQN